MRVGAAKKEAAPVTWRCFQCGHTVLQRALLTSRDGASWCDAPPNWFFTKDGDELTFVCSVRCLTAIYSNDT